MYIKNLFRNCLKFIRAHVTITDGIMAVTTLVSALATVIIALVTIRGCEIQEEMAKTSQNLAVIAEKSDDRDSARLQAELRPYLVTLLSGKVLPKG